MCLGPFHADRREVLTSRGEIWSTEAGAAELRLFRWTPPGDTALLVTSSRAPLPVSSAERDSALSAIRERLEGRGATSVGLDGSRVPSTEPPVYALSLDDRERIWVRITAPGIEPTIYDVFDRDGAYAETVELPFRVDAWIPPVVRGDTVWAVVVDDVEVQHIVRARLGSPPGA